MCVCVYLEGGEINAVGEFQYLVSVIASSGRMDMDKDRRVAQALKAFGAIRKAVFLDKNIRLLANCTMPVCCLSCYMVQSVGLFLGSMPES